MSHPNHMARSGVCLTLLAAVILLSGAHLAAEEPESGSPAAATASLVPQHLEAAPEAVSARLIAEFTQALDALVEQGLPSCIEDLDRWYPAPPEAENAALWYIRGLRFCRPPGQYSATILPLVGDGELPAPYRPFPPELRDLGAKHLQINEEALDFFHQAVSKPACRRPVDFRQVLEGLARQPETGRKRATAHLTQIPRAVDLLALEALLKTESGDIHGATQAVLGMISTSEHLINEPFIASLMTHCACLKRTLVLIECLLNRTAFPEEALASFQQALSALTLVELPNAFNALAKAAEAEALIAGAGAEAQSGEGNSQEAMAQAIVTQAQTTALLRAAITALAVERCRGRTRARPENLGQVPPDLLDAVPLDPFDGEPLRYWVLKSGYAVCSVGIDGLSDFDRRRPHARNSNVRPDVTFLVLRRTSAAL